MKTLIALIAIAALFGCARNPYPVLRVREYDPRNNRVDEAGQLVRWTNWGVGFYPKGSTNWIKLFQANEGE